MPDISLTKTRIAHGVWEGVLAASGPQPALEVRHQEAVVQGISVAPIPDQAGKWLVRVPVPVSALNDGVQTFIIRDKASGEKLTHFTIITGVAMEDDLRAEFDLLRAELDLLKRAFRRHCVETAT